MRIIPVIDLMAAHVVRGVAGRRAEYRPIESRLVAGSQPTEVAKAFRDWLQLEDLYVADLDAIAGAEPAWPVYESIMALGVHLWLDAGLRDAPSAVRFKRFGVGSVVAGLETLPGPEALAECIRQAGSEHVVFSLDLKGGLPLVDTGGWQTDDALEIAACAVAVGVRRMIVLDLARVGIGQGIGTEAICRDLRHRYTDLQLVAGGGVRGLDDMIRLQENGVDAVLVASALHDGSIGVKELAALPAG